MVKQKKESRKERTENFISKWAFTILFALCIQFVVYLVVLNFVPTFITVKNPTEVQRVSADLNSIDADGQAVTVLNPFYKTDNYYTTNGYFKSSIENPTMFIYYYNIILLVATLVLILYYFVNFMENNDGHMMKKIKKFLKEQWPFAILLIFMLWVLISSMLARDSYRSFVGCFNLKDGYLSFLMYGSMLVCSMLLIKNNEKYKKILVNTFLVTATIVAAVTLWNYYYLTSGVQKSAIWHEVTEEALEDNSIDREDIDNNYWIYNYLLTYGEDPSRTVVTIGELLFGNGGLPLGENFLIITKRVQGENHSGIFHNSNHYGYYLSICVIVAAVMFMKQSLRNKEGEIDIKNILLSVCYLTAYIIMLKMAILNNTLGAYLGIGASLIFMIVYAAFPKEKEIYLKEGVCALIVIFGFALLSATTVNESGKNIVYNNFSALANDFKTLIGVNDAKKDNIEENYNVIDTSSGNASGSAETTTSNNNEKDVADIGSGRGQLWVAGLKMALEPGHILFGYGLENLIYEYPRFDINEGRSHNLVIQLAATTGIIGMLLYVVAIASIWIRKLKYIKEWDLYECLGMFVIVSYIISSLVGNSGFYTSGYFYIFVGFIVLSYPKQTKTIDTKKK